MVFGWWLGPVPVSHVAGASTLRYVNERADVLTLSSVLRPIRLATSPRLLPPGPSRLAYVLLPYTKHNREDA